MVKKYYKYYFKHSQLNDAVCRMKNVLMNWRIQDRLAQQYVVYSVQNSDLFIEMKLRRTSATIVTLWSQCSYLWSNSGKSIGPMRRTVCWVSGRTISVLQTMHRPLFTARRNARIASAVLATAILSVCPSVRPSIRPSVRLPHAGIVSKRRHVVRCSLHCRIAKCV